MKMAVFMLTQTIKHQIKNKINTEEGIGFLESLIAIVVAGIACIALLSLSSSILKETARNEMKDAMNKYAVEGLDMVRRAILEKTGETVTCSPTATTYYYFHGQPKLIGTAEYSQLCSQSPTGNNCEKLPLRFGGENLFSREIEVTCAGEAMRINVRVQELIAGHFKPVNQGKYTINIVGYVPK